MTEGPSHPDPPPRPATHESRPEPDQPHRPPATEPPGSAGPDCVQPPPLHTLPGGAADLIASPPPPPPPPPAAAAATTPPPPRLHPPPRPLLLMFWCFWLLGSLMIILRYGPINLAAPPLMLAAMLGLLLAWPAYKLCQIQGLALEEQGAGEKRPGKPANGGIGKSEPEAKPPSAGLYHQSPRPDPRSLIPDRYFLRDTLQDWVGLNLIGQVVIWSLKVATEWTWVQAIWLTAALAAWSLLAGALIASGRLARRPGPRVLSMALCAAVLLAEPALMAAAGAFTDSGRALIWTMHISPIESLWRLSNPHGLWTVEPHHRPVIATAAAALAAWATLLVRGMGKPPRPPRQRQRAVER